MARYKFPKGHEKKGGRKKGVVNETTKLVRSVRELVLDTFNKIQDDPKVNLQAFAKNYPRDFYQIASKLIPTEIQAKVEQLPSPQIVLKVEKPE